MIGIHSQTPKPRVISHKRQVICKVATMIKHVDVGIVGTGFAGLSAALASRRAGAQTVLLLEKQGSPGGNSIYNAGQVAVVGSDKQNELGVDDSVELMVQDMRKAGWCELTRASYPSW